MKRFLLFLSSSALVLWYSGAAMAAAAMESIGRNPNAADKIFTPMLLGLAFIEALAIYALIIAFILQGKI